MKLFLFSLIKVLRKCLPAAFFIALYLFLVHSRKLKKILHRLLLQIVPEKILLPIGNTLYLNATDPVISTALLFDVYEPYTTKVFLQHLRPGMVVVDVGANIGYYSVLAAATVGPTGKVYAFEPDPENFAILKKNIDTNTFLHVEAFSAALSDRTGTDTLYLSPDNKGDHRLVAGLKEDRVGITVNTLSLDDFVATHGLTSVNVVKIDVQGAENLVMKGMSRLLQSPNAPVIFFEYWPGGLAASLERPAALIEQLWTWGFTIYEVSESRKSLILINKEWPTLNSYTPRTYLNLVAYKI